MSLHDLTMKEKIMIIDLPDETQVDSDDIEKVECYDEGIKIIFIDNTDLFVDCDEPEKVAEDLAIKIGKGFTID